MFDEWNTGIPAAPRYLPPPSPGLRRAKSKGRSSGFPIAAVATVAAVIVGIGVLGGAGWFGWRQFVQFREARASKAVAANGTGPVESTKSTSAGEPPAGPEGAEKSTPAAKSASQSAADEVEALNRLYRVPDGFVDATSSWLAAARQFRTTEFVRDAARFPLGAGSEGVPRPGKRWQDEQAAVQFLAKYATPLQAVRDLADKRAVARLPAKFDLGLACEVPGADALLVAAKLLLFDAQVRTRRQDASGAVRSLEAALLASRSMSSIPTATAGRGYISIEINVYAAAKTLMETNAVPLEDLARLQNCVEEIRKSTVEPLDLIGERSLTLISYHSPDNIVPVLFRETVGESIADNSVREQQAQSCLIATKQDLAADRALFQEFMDRLIAAARRPYPERLSAGEAMNAECQRMEAERTAQGRPHTVASISRLRLVHAIGVHAMRDLARGAMLAGIAIERKLRQTDSLPESLESLVPEYLASLPVDPITGQPLGYRPDPVRQRAVVYSAGPDGRTLEERGDFRNDQWAWVYDLPPLDRRTAGLAISGAGDPDAAMAGEEAIAAGPTVDLLQDLLRRSNQTLPTTPSHVLWQNGTWEYQSGRQTVVQNKSDTEVMWFTVPDELPASYLVELDVEPLSGQRSFNLAFPVGGHSVMLVIDGFDQQLCGLNLIDGKGADRNETTFQGPVLAGGEPTTIAIRVTPKGVLATADGRPIVNWQGDPSRLRLDSRYWPDPGNRLLLAAYHSRFKLTRFTLTPLR